MCYGLSNVSFFLEYTNDLRILVIKVEKLGHTNDALLASILGGLQDYRTDRPSI